MRMSDWSYDVCSSNLFDVADDGNAGASGGGRQRMDVERHARRHDQRIEAERLQIRSAEIDEFRPPGSLSGSLVVVPGDNVGPARDKRAHRCQPGSRQPEHGIAFRSEEHTSELQSLMRISYAVFCLKKKT